MTTEINNLKLLIEINESAKVLGLLTEQEYMTNLEIFDSQLSELENEVKENKKSLWGRLKR